MNAITESDTAKPSTKLTSGIPRVTPEQRDFIEKNSHLGPIRLSEICRPLSYEQVRGVLLKLRTRTIGAA